MSESNSTDPAFASARGPANKRPQLQQQQQRRHQQRILACTRCQHRKVKCNRQFPCANCLRSGVGANCQPPALEGRPPRRRRFPERELLDRLRAYEDLLRRNGISFRPMHHPATSPTSVTAAAGAGDNVDVDVDIETATGNDRPPSSSSSLHKPAADVMASKMSYQTKDFWHAMNQRSPGPGASFDSSHRGSVSGNQYDVVDEEEEDDDRSESSQDDVRRSDVKRAWEQLYASDDHLLFGPHRPDHSLATLHPGQAQMFRLWQIYLDNVNPLLKVTHTPTLQARIIDFASGLAKADPALEALMFSIYCVALLSLTENECRASFGSPREDLLVNYNFGCQQALLSCGVLKTNDRDCLTALYLYLIAIRPVTDPRSLSSMLAVTIRIAQRMGIHDEATNGKSSPFEGEMRRRLWWSLVLFDARMCELSDSKNTMLTPLWDCNIPLNVDDFDLRPEMKSLPVVHGKTSEAIFVVVRSEVGDSLRHNAFQLDFNNSVLKSVARVVQRGTESGNGNLTDLQTMIEDKYLRFCNLENPLHYMTLWTARGYLAKNHLMEYFAKYPSPAASTQPTGAQRDTAIYHAWTVLECDTKIMTSGLTERYHWLLQFHFPFPAYILIVQDLRRRPVGPHADKAWEVMSRHYEQVLKRAEAAASAETVDAHAPFFKIFSRPVLQAWDLRVSVFRKADRDLKELVMISEMKSRLAQISSNHAQPWTSEEGRDDPAAGASGGGKTMDDSLSFFSSIPSFPFSLDFGGLGEDNEHPFDFLIGADSMDGQDFSFSSEMNLEPEKDFLIS